MILKLMPEAYFSSLIIQNKIRNHKKTLFQVRKRLGTLKKCKAMQFYSDGFEPDGPTEKFFSFFISPG